MRAGSILVFRAPDTIPREYQQMTSASYTNGFVVHTEMGATVGFILGSPGFYAEAGDCVFMPVPESPSVSDSYIGRAFLEAKESGEHQWTGKGGLIEIGLNGQARLRITAEGRVASPTGSVIGKATPLPNKIDTQLSSEPITLRGTT